MTNNKKTIKKTFEGTVVSDKADKTIVVAVKRTKLHPKYLKRFTVTKKYQVHDPKNEYHKGERVVFVESRPISKHKCWCVVSKKQ